MRVRLRFALPLSLLAASGGVSCGGSSADGVTTLPDGVELRMTTTIPPATEVEQCQFFRLPEAINVNRDEVTFTSGSHHVLLYLTPYESIPQQNDAGEAVDTSKPFDCSAGVRSGWTVSNLIAGSQNATGESIVSFPPDVGMKVPAGAVVMLNVHYINASAQPVNPEVKLTLHGIPDSALKHEGGLLFWYNPFIRIEPMASGYAQMSCPIAADITLGNAQSHMHARGVGYVAERVAADGAREALYENTEWEGVTVKAWEGGQPIAGGSRIDFRCEYQNATSSTIWQGPRTTDEMCMFISSYWPAQPHVSLCSSDPAAPDDTQSMAGRWEGSGAATCSQTLDCVQALQGKGNFLEGLTECIYASAPEASPYVSDGVTCLLTHDNPIADCGPELEACLAH
jgi:hypothetical protein